MTLPFPIPDWLPWWVPIAILVPALLYALVFLCMPFSVIGVKGRLESVEARLDEIQAEIRSLTFRLPEPVRNPSNDYADPPPLMAPPSRREPPAGARPPIPPAAHYPDEYEDGPEYRPVRPRTAGRRDEPPPRSEPRLNWPR